MIDVGLYLIYIYGYSYGYIWGYIYGIVEILYFIII